MADRGSFRLGKVIDRATGKPGADDLVVGSSDLTTHGVIVGMTGSGKTGLAVVLLEEALLAGIPALIIDPKGDMGNLALTFPDLTAASFQPWVDASEAQAEGVTVEELAEKTATTWRQGLAAQGIGQEQIQKLQDAADVTIYTPGSSAGVPLNMLGSLRAPALSWDTEAETLRDEIEGTVTSLLGLVGIAADPLSSREHVLLSNLIENAWRIGRDLDLGLLIGEIQSPPLRKLGVFEIDAFFPPQDRTELALKLNALIASPAFAAWGEGAPLDPQSLLFTPEGKPRAAIIYLAHLSDEERMYVTTLVFAKLVTWMRGQPGTSAALALDIHRPDERAQLRIAVAERGLVGGAVVVLASQRMQPVQLRDLLDPAHCPAPQGRMVIGHAQEVPALVRPADRQAHARRLPGELAVRAVAVDAENALTDPLQRSAGDPRRARRVEHEAHHRVRLEHPQVPAVADLAFDLLEDLPARLVGMPVCAAP